MEDKNVIEQEIANLISQRDALKLEIEAYKNDINTATEGKPTLREQMTSRLATMESTISTISANVDKINQFHNEILRPKDGQDKSQFEFFKEAYASVSSDKIKSDAEVKAIENYKIELLGDQEKNIVGQRQRIDELENEIKVKKKLWEDNSDALFKKIEGLLPGATATGLAKAYEEQRKSYNKPYWGWASVFVITLCCIIWFAIANLIDADSVEKAFLKVISRLPFFVPAFWLAIFASKQQSQNKRLQQEYAHKESLAKSYEADKREIEKLPDSPEKNKLSEKLLDTMIESAKFNPSETLGSKTHNDGPPSVFELFKIKMLKKLTGADKIN
jgi:flagellar motility protein MotE (MotC chaperone)